MENKKSLIEQFAPYPLELYEQRIRELRASEDFVDIQIKSRAPKGKYCNNCENLSTKYEPRICSWNDEITDLVSFPYCNFFNSRLVEDKSNACCNKPCLKCFACLMQTGDGSEDANKTD